MWLGSGEVGRQDCVGWECKDLSFLPVCPAQIACSPRMLLSTGLAYRAAWKSQAPIHVSSLPNRCGSCKSIDRAGYRHLFLRGFVSLDQQP